MQVIEYAKDESVALKKTWDGWKSNKRQKAENKAAAANKQARAEPQATEQQQGAAAADATAAAPSRSQVRVIYDANIFPAVLPRSFS